MNVEGTPGGGIFAATAPTYERKERLRTSLRQSLKRATDVISPDSIVSFDSSISRQSRPKRAGKERPVRRIERKSSRSLRSSTIAKRETAARKCSSLTTMTSTTDHDHEHDDSKSGHGKVSFPVKLFDMLTDLEERGQSNVVSWQSHGRAIKVHDPQCFVEDVLPHYFRQTKITSFQRQLNVYGFRRIVYGKDAGAYHHTLFLRGVRNLAFRITRIGIKGTGVRSTYLFEEEEPDFHSMPPIQETIGGKLNLSEDEATIMAQVLMTEKSIQVDKPLVERLVDMQLDVSEPNAATADYDASPDFRSSLSAPSTTKVDGCTCCNASSDQNQYQQDQQDQDQVCGCKIVHTEDDRINFEGQSFYYMDSQLQEDKVKTPQAENVEMHAVAVG